MALPPGIIPKTVTLGPFTNFDGTVCTGRVTIGAPENVLYLPTGAPLVPNDMVQQLKSDGTASFMLCPTDADGLNRKDWTYRLTVEISGASKQLDIRSFPLPSAGPDGIDLDSLVTVPSSAGVPIAVDVLRKADFAPSLLTELNNTASATSVALRAAFVAPEVIAPAATGVVATDTAALQAAINAVPTGGRLYLQAGRYKINAPLVVPRSMSIEGDSVVPLFAGKTASGSPTTPTGLAGTVIEQTSAGKDGIQILASGVSVNLARLGVLFTAGLGTTGHGVNALVTQTFATGHDMGMTDFVFEQVYVYGHDGDHYAFAWLNPQYGTVSHCRSYGGGGYYTACDTGAINAGNILFNHPYSVIYRAGSAAGYGHSSAVSSGAPGVLNLLTYIRPQVIIADAVAATANANALWHDGLGPGVPQGINSFGADFETANMTNNPFLPGTGSTFSAIALINGIIGANTRLGTNALPNWTGATVGSANTAIGAGAMRANTTGSNNVAVGGALQANTTGSNNTALGNLAQQGLTTGANNTTVGFNTLSANTTGSSNVAVGRDNLRVYTGSSQTAIGHSALWANTTGTGNTAVGYTGLYSTTTGANNTCVGDRALYNITTQSGNTAVGNLAGYNAASANNTLIGGGAGQNTTTGASNTAVGQAALQTNTTGANNTAIGQNALFKNDVAANNTALGNLAGYNSTGSNITVVGSGAMQNATTGGSNTAVGYQAGVTQTGANQTTTASNQTLLGYQTGQSSATQANDITALGWRAVAGSTGNVAVGSGAQATHTNAVALGYQTATTATDQVNVGARDVETTGVGKGFVMKSPDGTRYRIVVANGGALSTVAA